MFATGLISARKRALAALVALVLATLVLAPVASAGPVIDGQSSAPAEWALATVFTDNLPTLEPADPDFDLTNVYLYLRVDGLCVRWDVAGTPQKETGVDQVNYALQFDVNGDSQADFWITRNPMSIAATGTTAVYLEKNPFGAAVVAATYGTFALDSSAAAPAAEAIIPYAAFIELGYGLPLTGLRVLAVIDGANTDSDDISGWENYEITVPEPATIGLLSLGLIGLVVRRKK